MTTLGDRLVGLEGAYNFRDLGGYPTTDGRRTRWRRLYRADALHALTATDTAVLRRLPLAAVIDLRTSAELERTGRGALATEEIAYHHLSILQVEAGETVAAPPVAEEDMAERYLWYLQTGREAIAAALGVIADAADGAVVFHCTAGKDRTGVLAALVLSAVGVGDETIVADYVATAERLPLIIERLRSDPLHGPRMRRIPAQRYQIEAVTMSRFLDGLRQRYGGARSWAESVGVAASTMDALEATLLESGPGAGEAYTAAGSRSAGGNPG